MRKTINSERIPIKLWLKNIEPGALAQAKDLANLSVARKWIAIMPDCHKGYGMPIGGVMATEDTVVPNAVGVDIGCGMVAAKTSIGEIDTPSLKRIIAEIKHSIPVGFEHNPVAQSWKGFDQAPDIPVVQRELASARKQLGTLGGGNHFIEIQRGDDGLIWLMLHSGSRNFGYKIAREFQQQAKTVVARNRWAVPTSDLSFLPLDSNEGLQYLDAMQFALRFASASRAAMLNKAALAVKSVTGARVEQTVNIHHNYAALERHFGQEFVVHRKGATKATKGLQGIIPGSMGAASYIVEGLGNPDSFMSCSHGAGRAMGRRQAKRKLDLNREQRNLYGIVHDLRSKKRLDEAPSAYKDIDEVMQCQRDLVRLTVRLSPLAVVKG